MQNYRIEYAASYDRGYAHVRKEIDSMYTAPKTESSYSAISDLLSQAFQRGNLAVSNI